MLWRWSFICWMFIIVTLAAADFDDADSNFNSNFNIFDAPPHNVFDSAENQNNRGFVEIDVSGMMMMMRQWKIRIPAPQHAIISFSEQNTDPEVLAGFLLFATIYNYYFSI